MIHEQERCDGGGRNGESSTRQVDFSTVHSPDDLDPGDMCPDQSRWLSTILAAGLIDYFPEAVRKATGLGMSRSAKDGHGRWRHDHEGVYRWQDGQITESHQHR